jgi:DNA-binding SARP family transcriptional activator
MPLATPPETPTAFKLVTLGGASLSDGDGHTPIGLGSGKPLALLCFLAVRGEVRREEALALLWDDADEERGRNAFRQALHRLRGALGEELVGGDRQVLRLDAANRLSIDVGDFESAIRGDRLDEALALYRGDFLEGFNAGSRAFDDWAAAERNRLRDRCRFAAEQAAQRALADGRLGMAEIALQRLRRLANLDAAAVESLAAGFVSLGRQADAAEVIAEFARHAAANGDALPRSLQSMRDRLLPAATARATTKQAADALPFESGAQLAQLMALWNAVGDNTGGTAVVEMHREDQSRLVRSFIDGARTLGNSHVLHAAESLGLTAPYAALAAALRPLVRASGISGASPHLLAEAARLLPELRDSFQLPAVETLGEDTARLRICEGVAALLEAAAFERRTCLIFEGAHLSSDATIELLGHLASRLRRSPVLLIVTLDPERADPSLAAKLSSLAGGAGALQSDRYLLRSGAPAVAARDAGGIVRTYLPHWRVLSVAAVATVITAIIATALRPAQSTLLARTNDTLLVETADDARNNLVRAVNATPAGNVTVSDALARSPSSPAWADSIQLPWVNAIPAPFGRHVALERVTAAGSHVYVISADRRDTLRLSAGDGDALGLGWSPDGTSFLVSERRRVGDEDLAGLYAFSMAHPGERVAIDTGSTHTVTEAAWSPDGSHIAWVARERGGQEEVFVAWADGRNRRNVSNHIAQDDHLRWSPDGSMLTFTSRRDGNAELYAFDFVGDKLWRLTRDPAHDDRAFFDRDGRVVAFESTRGGTAGVYVMPSLGGEPSRVGDSSAYAIAGWRSARPRYLERLQLRVPPRVQRGDTITLVARGVDRLGAGMPQWDMQWSVVDAQFLRAIPTAARMDSTLEAHFVALAEGLARVVVTAGAWRTDTAYVKIGDGSVALLRDDFSGREIAGAWRALGTPRPHVVRGAARSLLVPNADRQWESGILSARSLPLRPGLAVEAALTAPFESRSPASTATLALVAVEPPSAVDTVAPRFLKLVSITWNAEAQRFVYAAERDVFAEPVPLKRSVDDSRRLEIVIDPDGRVIFSVDGVQRWISTLRVVSGDRTRLVQLWIGGHDTGARVGFSNVSALLDGAGAARR